MRKTLLAAAGAAVLLSATSAQASTGPFSGNIRQNQTKTHHYDNNPQNNACPMVMTDYTVTLQYTPVTDTLTLTAGGQTATGSNGLAVVSFMASYCTAFDITVTGTSVVRSASYTVTVTRGEGGVIA